MLGPEVLSLLVPWPQDGSVVALGRLARQDLATMDGFGKVALEAKNMGSFLDPSIHVSSPLVPSSPHPTLSWFL